MADNAALSGKDERKERLDELRREHRDLDSRITALTSHPYLTPQDQIEVASLKKLKLKKKDQILKLSSELGASA
ncbi:MAG: DUF465 domain-containing protein [Deltaproteobacteria bacterium]|nr:DUF465 domain-containing protein [Deltaproteobacteria bacterium]